MLEWYLAHIYILPWWAYAVPLYLLIGLAFMRSDQILSLRGESHGAWVWVWPLMLLIGTVGFVASSALWLLGFTDTLPFSDSDS